MDVNKAMLDLESNKPSTYDGQMEFLTFITWIYQVEQYFYLLQMDNPADPLSNSNKLIYSSTYLTSSANIWWFPLTQKIGYA